MAGVHYTGKLYFVYIAEHWGVYAKMTATTTPENNDLIGSMRKNNRAARTLSQFFDVVC